MLYFSVFLLLLFCSFHELETRKSSRQIFNIVYLFLTFMLVFRQGQGSDYYNYRQVYNEIASTLDNSFLGALLYTDPGYSLINIIAIKCGIGYKFMTMLISLATMVISRPFFFRYCGRSIASLLLFFPMGFLIYYFSAVRQALAMSIILSSVPPLLLNSKKKWHFFISVLIASMFHLSAIVCLIIPFVYNIRIPKWASIVIICISVVMSFGGVEWMFQHLPAPLAIRMNNYSGGSESSYLAISLRLIDLIPILLIKARFYNRYPYLRRISNLLLVGFVLYALLSFSDLTASRMNYYFRMFEVLFFSQLIRTKEFKTTHISIGLIYLCISFVLYIHNINGFISQGSYSCESFVEYPYFSVLADERTIASFRVIQ